MPRVHISLTNPRIMQEWDVVEGLVAQAREHKPLRRPRHIQSESQERRLNERRKRQRRSDSMRHYFR
jgi:hypothetical protein